MEGDIPKMAALPCETQEDLRQLCDKRNKMRWKAAGIHLGKTVSDTFAMTLFIP